MGAHASDGLRPDNPIVDPEATKITGIARECLRAEAGNQLRAAGTMTAFSVPDTHETVPSLREAPRKNTRQRPFPCCHVERQAWLMTGTRSSSGGQGFRRQLPRAPQGTHSRNSRWPLDPPSRRGTDLLLVQLVEPGCTPVPVFRDFFQRDPPAEQRERLAGGGGRHRAPERGLFRTPAPATSSGFSVRSRDLEKVNRIRGRRPHAYGGYRPDATVAHERTAERAPASPSSLPPYGVGLRGGGRRCVSLHRS